MAHKFKKKPVVIEAVQWKGYPTGDMCAFVGTVVFDSGRQDVMLIDTLEGTMRAEVGDYIIRGIKGEFYPCKPEIFAATYEPALDDVAVGLSSEPPICGDLLAAARSVVAMYGRPDEYSYEARKVWQALADAIAKAEAR